MRRPFSTQTDDPLEAMLLKFVRVLHGLKVKQKKVLEIFTNFCRFQNIILYQNDKFNSGTKCFSWYTCMRRNGEGRGDGPRHERWKGERKGSEVQSEKRWILDIEIEM